MDGALGTDAFLCPLLGHVVIVNENKMLTMFLMLKSSMFYYSDREDAYESILYLNERLH